MFAHIQIGDLVKQSIAVLESRRTALYRQLEALDDFRRGTISVNYRKGSKSNCACAREDHPGHGPQYLWNASIGGKTQSENLTLGPELEKVENEVQRYRIFAGLCQQIAAFNNELCHLRPVPAGDDENELELLKKKLRKHFAAQRTKK